MGDKEEKQPRKPLWLDALHEMRDDMAELGADKPKSETDDRGPPPKPVDKYRFLPKKKPVPEEETPRGKSKAEVARAKEHGLKEIERAKKAIQEIEDLAASKRPKPAPEEKAQAEDKKQTAEEAGETPGEPAQALGDTPEERMYQKALAAEKALKAQLKGAAAPPATPEMAQPAESSAQDKLHQLLREQERRLQQKPAAPAIAEVTPETSQQPTQSPAQDKLRQLLQKQEQELQQKAAAKNNPAPVLKDGASTSVTDKDTAPALVKLLQEKLHKAIIGAELDEADALLKKGVVPLKETLDYAVDNGLFSWIEKFVAAGGKPTSEMLHRAVTTRYNNPRVAEALMAGGAVPEEKTLKFAVDNGWSTWIEKLVKAGAKPNADLLHEAVTRHYQDTRVADALIAGGAVPEEKTLKFAVDNGWAEWIEKLVRAGAKPNAEMLQVAVTWHYNDPSVADALIAGGAVPEERTLDYAVRNGWAEWIKKLAKAGAKPNTEMLHVAVTRHYNDPSVADALIAGGAVPEERTLDYAVRNGWVEWIKKLAKAGAKPNAEMLHVAVTWHYKDPRITDALITAGAVPEERTLDFAVKNGWASWIQKLTKAGAKPTSAMLYQAVTKSYNDPGVADALIAAGAVPDEKTLGFAIKNGWTSWIEKLAKAGAKPTSEMLHDAVAKGPDNTQVAAALIAAGAVPAQKTVELATYKNWTNLRTLLEEALRKNDKTKMRFIQDEKQFITNENLFHDYDKFEIKKMEKTDMFKTEKLIKPKPKMLKM